MSGSGNGGADGLTLGVIGCGTLGTAILRGILSSLTSDASKTTSEDLPPKLPTKFITAIRSEASVKRIKATLAPYNASLEVIQNDNVKCAQASDVVLLGCKPYMYKDILSAKGMKEALAGKTLISILAGVTSEAFETFLYGSASTSDPISEGKCRVIRAMPNTAAAIGESMTVIATTPYSLPKADTDLLTWIFTRIGRVSRLPPNNLDAVTSLCGSGPAFMALVMDALADGGVAMGIPRAEAQVMAAQVMRGASGLVLEGEHPAIVKDKICTPGGCTIGGLMTLEDAGVRGSISRAVREATVVASQLGEGVKNVNGTRH